MAFICLTLWLSSASNLRESFIEVEPTFMGKMINYTWIWMNTCWRDKNDTCLPIFLSFKSIFLCTFVLLICSSGAQHSAAFSWCIRFETQERCTYCEWYEQTDPAWYCEKPSCWFAALPLMVTQRKHSMTQKLNDWSLGALPPWVYL